ncbi:leukocyte immunoglobulin-like receptor subfamily A member 6 [Alexandromys fortis]|uniref:leukocyte immunoglobulin-like receptor subfamily A member 6 n=1 Tax=Alexandromys fortis TaxID=100897 RepID=UPI002152A507|nr:leukocyte immunoglobulin-like receptor subfamily A member 6 [Microtus fortis]
MIFTAIAMLCLGLTLGFRSPVLAGDPYSKPRLSALDSHVVNAGGNVTLQCISWQKYDGFILIKEGEPKFSRTLDSHYIFTGHLQAMFSLGPMTSRNMGTFRCYGFYKRDPQKLSMPSDPLEVHISGSEGGTSAPFPHHHMADERWGYIFHIHILSVLPPSPLASSTVLPGVV